MYKGNSLLGIIPARGGSKGLPNKNIKVCAGKPLIEWTISAANGSQYLDRVIVSTDSKDIANVAKECNCDVPFLRPRELASDTSAIMDAVHHALARLNDEGETYEHVVLLQPTSPLRTSNDIDRAIEMYFEVGDCNERTLISVYRADAKYALLMHKNGSGFMEFALPIDISNPRRQVLPECFLPNGAIYIGNMAYSNTSFYGDKTIMYEMPINRSVDVDTIDDLNQAEKLLLFVDVD